MMFDSHNLDAMLVVGKSLVRFVDLGVIRSRESERKREMRRGGSISEEWQHQFSYLFKFLLLPRDYVETKSLKILDPMHACLRKKHFHPRNINSVLS